MQTEPVNGFFCDHHAKATSWPQYSRCREKAPVHAFAVRRGSARILENLPKTTEISRRHFEQLRGRMVYMRTIAVFADIAERQVAAAGTGSLLKSRQTWQKSNIFMANMAAMRR